MATEMHKLMKDGNTIYPATTTDAVVHPQVQAPLTDLINEYNVSVIWPTGGADAGNKYTLETAIAKLDSALTSAEKIKGVIIKFYDGNSTLQEYTYLNGTFREVNSWIPTGHRVVNELNISNLYPTNGEGGNNKYTLEMAIAQVPAEYRTIVGLKITFINNETSLDETWVYNGGTFNIVGNWAQFDSKILSNLAANIIPPIKGSNLFNIADKASYKNAYIEDGGVIRDNDDFYLFTVNVEENSSYIINDGNLWAIGFYNNDTYLSFTRDNYTRKFTTPMGCNIVKMSTQKQFLTIESLIINKGTVIAENSTYWEPYVTKAELNNITDQVDAGIESIDNKYKETLGLIASRIRLLDKNEKFGFVFDESSHSFIENASGSSCEVDVPLFEQSNFDIEVKIRIYLLGNYTKCYLTDNDYNIIDGPFYSKNDIPVYKKITTNVRKIIYSSDTQKNVPYYIFYPLVIFRNSVSSSLENKAERPKGRNLFNKDSLDIEYASLNNKGALNPMYGITSLEATNNFWTSHKIYVKPSTRYTITGVFKTDNAPCLCYNKSDEIVKTITEGSTVDTTEDTAYIILGQQQSLQGSNIKEFAIMEGEEAVKNEPYYCDKILTTEEYNTINKFMTLNSQWKGLTWGGIGDSIMEMNSWPGTGQYGWSRIVNHYFGFKEFINKGIGGTLLAMINDNSTTAMCSWDRIKQAFPAEIKETISLVALMGGTNDISNNIPLGDKYPKWSAENTYDYAWMDDSEYNVEQGDFNCKEFGGAVCSAILKLQRWMPKARIVVISPVSGLTLKAGENSTDFVYDTNNKSLLDYSETMRYACKVMATPFIDLNAETGINQFNSKDWIDDGVHPTWTYTKEINNGGSQMARVMIGGLKNIYPYSPTGYDSFFNIK